MLAVNRIMSQFLIINGNKKPKINTERVSVIDVQSTQQLFKKAVEHYKLPLANTWVPGDDDSDTIDNLFSEAAYQVSAGDRLSKTNLGKLLGVLIKKYSIYAWYGNDFEDLDKLENSFELYELLNKELPVGSGEIYIKYHS